MPLPLILLAAGATGAGLTAAGLISTDTPRPEGHSGDQIYRWFHEEAKTPTAGLNPIEEVWRATAEKYRLVRDQLEQVIKASHGVWQGAAAEAARQRLSPLADYAETAMNLATSTAAAVHQQTVDWYSCKNQLKPVASEPPQNNLLNKLTPFDTDLDQEIEKFRADTADNQRVLYGYGAREADNVTKLPTWGTPGQAGGDVSVVQPGGAGGVDRGRDAGRITPGGPGGGPGGGQGGSGGQGGGQPGATGGTGVLPGGQQLPGPSEDTTGVSGSQGTRVGGPAAGIAGTGSSSGGLGAGGSAQLGAGFGPHGGFGPGGSAGFGPGDGFGPGGRAGVGGSAGARPGPGGSAGVGRHSGSGALPFSPAARPGQSAMTGLPIGAMPLARRDEEEHERPTYLEETEDVFGDTRYAAPPVIGEE